MSTIEDATASDIKALAAFSQKQFAETFHYVPYSADNLRRHLDEKHGEAFFRNALAQGDMLLIAKENAVIAGYAHRGAMTLPVEKPEEPSCELYRLYVDAFYHGTGLAHRLMQHVLSNETIYLSVFSENERAQAFYTKYGFQKVGEYD